MRIEWEAVPSIGVSNIDEAISNLLNGDNLRAPNLLKLFGGVVVDFQLLCSLKYLVFEKL